MSANLQELGGLGRASAEVADHQRPGLRVELLGAAGEVAQGDVAEGSFFEIAADAMGIDVLHQIDTGLDPVTAEREQWDDGNNTLAIAPRVAVAYERNEQTNERLRDHGIDVIAISGSELGSGQGGPRCMSCPVMRD